MDNKIIIEYSWSINSGGEAIKETHREALEEKAFDRIVEQMKEGYRGGELLDNVRMSEEDGDDGVEYSGWWSMTTERL